MPWSNGQDTKRPVGQFNVDYQMTSADSIVVIALSFGDGLRLYQNLRFQRVL